MAFVVLPSLLFYSSGRVLRLLLLWLVVVGLVLHDHIAVLHPAVVSNFAAAAADSTVSSAELTRALQSAQDILQKSKSSPSRTASSSTTMTTTTDWPEQQVQTVQHAVDRYASLRHESDALIRQVNVRQIQQLISQLHTLREAVTKQQQTPTSASSSSENQTTTRDDDDDADDRWWKERLDPTVILDPAEAALAAWIETLMWQELEQLQLQQQQVSLSTDSPQKLECLTASVAVTHVYAALNTFARDGIGRDDLFQQPGTVIVHEFTSSTYQPPPAAAAAALSSSHPQPWYDNPWMPQDWEEAWRWLRREHAAVADTVEQWFQPHSWPAHLYHTLGWRRTAVAPPETVLQNSLWPGACWPVAMTKPPSNNNNNNNNNQNHNPTITIRLATPRAVTALSLDHVSAHLVEDRSTAPHRVRVYGYAPCSTTTTDKNNNCDGRGFDVTSKFILANELVYHLDSASNIQTFPLGPAIPWRQHHHDHADNKDEDDAGGSCAAPDPALAGGEGCGGVGETLVAAVTLEILSNHGHPDYTCLYRVRIHADHDDHDAY